MSSLDRSEWWTAVALDALVWLRPVTWAALACLLWFTVVAPAQADTFPFPPPGTGCPPNTSCIPGGGLPGGGNPGQCTPNPNGNPGCNGAGNPVDIITGNKYQHEIDLAPLPGEMSLHFSRHYNSNSTHRGLTGVGWRSTYEIVLVDLGSALQIIDADGRRLTFDRHTQQPGLCVGARPEDGRVIVDEGKDKSDAEANGRAQKNRGVTYRWQRLDGSEYTFHSGSGDGHPLQSIRAASGATMTLTYLGGALDSVRDAQGRTLRFVYARPLAAGSTRHRMLTLSAIETPVGRVSYKHDEFGRLQSAIQPNSLVRRYHYEPERQGAAHNTWTLTGISVESTDQGKVKAERIATYAYDAQGRAVRTRHAGGDDLTLTYGPKAATTIATAKGARTVYRHALVAGQWQTVEAIGPGCATCPASNVRYRYRTVGPHAGQLEAALQLDAQGKPLRQERVTADSWGRPVRLERISYVGKAGAQSRKIETLVRAEYAAITRQPLLAADLSAAQYASLWRPRIIARPSIVSGYERSVVLSYNAHLQPVTVAESGVSPIDASGNFVATSLTRTTTYSYTQIAGISRLTAIDGPLPGRADITTLHYDDVGRLRLVRQPSDLQQRYAYDEAGRIVWHMPADAVPVRRTFDASGEPSVWQRGETKVSVERDALGRPLRIELPDGEVRWVGHGGTGGLGAVISNRGWGRWHVPTLEAAQHLARFLAADAGTEAPTRGRFAAPFNGGGSSTSTWGAIDVRRDDFGRLVALRTEATGLEVRRYDEGDRLVARHFADGGIWRYERDAAGRVVTHAVAAPNAETVVTRIHWFGAYAIRVEHPNETEDRRYDGSGRLTERSVERASGVRFTERFGYDAADRLTAHDLPEGGTLQYAWGIGAQLRAINYQSPTGRTQSLIEPLPRPGAVTATRPPTTPIALQRNQSTDIPQVAAGGYRFGNGIEARWRLNSAGQLATLEHRGTELSGGTQASWWSNLFAWIPAAWAHGDATPIAGWQYGYDPLGRMATRADANASVVNNFGYDELSRLVISEPSAMAAERAIQARRQNVATVASIPKPDSSTREYYAYNARGFTLGRRVNSNDDDFRTLAIDRTTGGLPRQIGTRMLGYSADRRLIEVQDAGQPLARYRHNAQGERIGKHVPAHGATDYLYARHQLAAETVTGQPDKLARRYVYAHGVPIALIDYPHGQALRSPAEQEVSYTARVMAYAQALRDRIIGSAPRIAYVHANEIGTPVAVTDGTQRVQWRAQYRVYGEANIADAPTLRAAGSFALHLRLPGQYWDAETGWHDNYLRTYDPARGEYLEPDPLGPIGGLPSTTQPFSYVNHNPTIFADPLGLVLFAFDGTDNTNDEQWLNSRGGSLSNVWRFFGLYSDGNRRYVTGVGTVHADAQNGNINPPWLDNGANWTGSARISRMIQYFNDESDIATDNSVMDVDIVGFSRGAAQARDFANQIVSRTRNGVYTYTVRNTDGTTTTRCQKVNFRFMGLWDTVLSTNLGRGYNLSIPSEFRSVAQAVALNEYRGTNTHPYGSVGAFPLESIMQGPFSTPPVAGQTRIERGFIGAHADIGGGFRSDESQLAQVALTWMINQAISAGVGMQAPPSTIIANPVLHDKSDSILTGVPDPRSEDRQVKYRDGSTTTQRQMTFSQGMTYSDTQTGNMISYISDPNDPRLRRFATGTVNMQAYLNWLNANGYGINLTVQ